MAKKKKKKARKEATPARGKRPATKAKKGKKAKKAKKAVVRKAPKRSAAKKAKQPAAKKTAKKAKKRPKSKDVIGEGNYTASRNFRKEETSFIRNNRGEIAAKAKEAEAALEGPEGDELRRADEESGNRGQM